MKPGPVEPRFWSKVSRGNGDSCWIWTAYKDSNGYGRFSLGGRSGRMELAHRVAWNLTVGPVPQGLELDHLCRNRACVNPAHLEPVTHQVNNQRGIAGEVNGARQRSITHCPHGHEYTAENTRVRPNGARCCRACVNAYTRRRYAQDPERYRRLARERRARG